MCWVLMIMSKELRSEYKRKRSDDKDGQLKRIWLMSQIAGVP